MSRIQNKVLWTARLAVFCMVSMLFIFNFFTKEVHAASGYEFVFLGSYRKTMEIGDEFYLVAITSNGKKPSFSSSDSKVASVNTYGKITAKKAGTATITAKIKNGEASCKITVKKTTITLSKTSLSLENGYSAVLTAKVSTGHPVTWKSSKKSIATVDENGHIQAKKPGTTTITATADKTTVSCKVTVRKPTVRLNKGSVSMYRKEKITLKVTTTSKSMPKWKSNKKSVAVVDAYGNVTAVKNGTATITVTVDGVSRTCQIRVKKPTIRFESDSITISKGGKYKLKVTVSSGNNPEYSSSNTNVVTVDENGRIYGKSAGKAYVYAKEDGTKERITVIVE